MDLTVSSLEQLLEALLGRLDHQLDYGTILRAKLLQSIQNPIGSKRFDDPTYAIAQRIHLA